MILVVLGTFPTQFRRPLDGIEELCRLGDLKEKIIVQSGYTTFCSDYMTFLPFLDLNELTSLYSQARIVISHAGTGSVVKALKMEKKVIAIARLAKYGEVVDDHQVEMVDEFAREGYLIPWRQNDSLGKLLKTAEEFKPKPYISRKEKIITFLTDYIDSL